MESINLNGLWDLYFYSRKERSVEDFESLKASDIVPIQAVVPGNVELDLVRSGILPEPFIGDNIHNLKEYEYYDWWYSREFDTPVCNEGNTFELKFFGVDCIADYYINGKYIGHSENMFIEHSFVVDRLLNREGKNTIAIHIKSPLLEAANKRYTASMKAGPTNWESLWIRKAPHSYGWDIMPRVLSAGLWRGVELVVHGKSEIDELYFYTINAEKGSACLGIYYNLKLAYSNMDGLSIKIAGKCRESEFSMQKNIYFSAGNLSIYIENPKLWWPKGYGEACLYEIVAEILHNGQVISSRCDTVGIRKAELIRTEITTSENPGQFMFKVNGVPILCKGSNWVPADAFHSRDAARYERMIGLFNDLGCNIIRCWGGNVYEDHEFFNLCDRCGLMVWQDFAMACAAYPQDEEFYSMIREEAQSVVKKLRNHPSIILWSGDNECDETYMFNGMDPQNNMLTREVLPKVILQHDPYRNYLMSSPYYSKEVVKMNGFSNMPEQHLWGPRDYYKSRFYSENTAHFVSEIGYHGCPNLSSIKRFIDEEHLWPWQDNSQWITHCTESIGMDGPYAYRIKLMADQIRELFGLYPENMEDFILASQISQAEAKKFFIEMVRLRKWRMTGIIWWNMIDGWPQFSDAIVDYYFGKKLAYYYIKRVQNPVCIMISEMENWHVKAVIGNDSLESHDVSYKVWDADSDEVLLQGRAFSHSNENIYLGKIRVSRGEQRMLLMRWEFDGKVYCNHYLLGSPPFSLEKYKKWLQKVALLDGSFDFKQIGK